MKIPNITELHENQMCVCDVLRVSGAIRHITLLLRTDRVCNVSVCVLKRLLAVAMQILDSGQNSDPSAEQI